MANFQKSCEIFLEYCANEKKLNEKTLRAYAIDLRQFEEFLDEKEVNVDINDIKKELLKEYIDGLVKKNKTKTVNRKIATLKGMYSYLEVEDVIDINPFRKLKLEIAKEETIPAIMTIQEVKKLFKTAYQVQKDFPYKTAYSYRAIIRDIAIMELLFATGARISEIVELKKDDLHFEKGNLVEVMIMAPSRKSKRTIDLTSNKDVLKALEKYFDYFEKEISQSEHLFINRLGNTLTQQSVRFMVKKYADMAGIKKHITPHIFRHTFAKMLIDNGMDMRNVQQLLGHSSIITTQLYLDKADDSESLKTGKQNPRNRIS